MNNLIIEVADNGFIVREGAIGRAYAGRTWAFESSDSLAKFMAEWGFMIEEEKKQRLKK